MHSTMGLQVPHCNLKHTGWYKNKSKVPLSMWRPLKAHHFGLSTFTTDALAKCKMFMVTWPQYCWDSVVPLKLLRVVII